MVILLHSFNAVYNYDWAVKSQDKILQLPKYVLAIGGLVSFVGSWMAYFLLISCTVSALGFARRVMSGKDIRVARNKQLVTGVAILLVSILSSAILNGILSKGIRTGVWTDLSSVRNWPFSMGTLHMIGYAAIITALISYFLLRNGGVNKVWRNVAIYAGLALLVVILSPLVQMWIDHMPWAVPPPPETGTGSKLMMVSYSQWPSSYVQRYNASLKSWICTVLAGDLEPFFPYLATAFAGSAIGLALAGLRSDRRVPKLGLLVGAVSLVTGVSILLLGHQKFTFGNSRPGAGEYLAMLGVQLLIIFVYLLRVEYRGLAPRFAQDFVGRRMRLWSMASLTLFCLDVFMLLPRFIAGLFMRLIGVQIADPFITGVFGYGQEHWAILFAIFSMFCYDQMVYWWSRVSFKYSLEWCVVAFNALLTGERSQRLDVGKVLGGRPADLTPVRPTRTAAGGE
jgi:hypothetical protein